ncbi:MAG: hypothetical protein HOV79_00080 [Hamadaea sp.]|nr:hypothetical protein [Hamadaea sp.]
MRTSGGDPAPFGLGLSACPPKIEELDVHDDQPPGRRLQPLLHDLVTVVRAPAMVLSAADGQLRGVGAHGLFQGDYRMLSHAVLLIDGREAEPIAHTLAGPAAARFTSLIRWAGDAGADPTLRLDRVRRLGPEGMTEEVRISSTARTAVTFTVTVDLGCDFAPIEEVKAGGDAAPHLAHLEAGRLAWRQGVLSVVVTAPGADLEPDLDARLAWEVTVPPGGRADLRWTVAVTDPRAVLVTPPAAPEWTRPEIRTYDRRLTRLLTHSLDDL